MGWETSAYGIWPAACFHMAGVGRVSLTFLNGCKNQANKQKKKKYVTETLCCW